MFDLGLRHQKTVARGTAIMENHAEEQTKKPTSCPAIYNFMYLVVESYRISGNKGKLFFAQSAI